jgi:hypothetical protein
MNGALLCISLLVYGLAWGAFYGADHKAKPENKQENDPGTKHRWERTGAVFAGAATFGALLALAGVLGQVWTDAGEGLGLFILVIVTVSAGAFGWYAIARGWKHHRHSTLALGIVMGGAAALDYGDWKVIRSNTGKYLASAGHGITGAASGKAGAVAAHGHAAGGGTWGIILILIAAVVLGVIIIRKHRKGEVVNVAPARRGNALPASGARPIGGGSSRPGRTSPLADPMLAGNGS